MKKTIMCRAAYVFRVESFVIRFVRRHQMAPSAQLLRVAVWWGRVQNACEADNNNNNKTKAAHITELTPKRTAPIVCL